MNEHQTILVVEDHEPLREFVRQVLEVSGYTVLAAHDTDSARSVWERHRERIGLLITDIAMPGGSGLDLCSELLPQQPGLRAIVMSGHGPEQVADSEYEALGAGRLRKPFSMDELVGAVRDMVAGSG